MVLRSVRVTRLGNHPGTSEHDLVQPAGRADLRYDAVGQATVSPGGEAVASGHHPVVPVDAADADPQRAGPTVVGPALGAEPVQHSHPADHPGENHPVETHLDGSGPNESGHNDAQLNDARPYGAELNDTQSNDTEPNVAESDDTERDDT
jgi:hypothetical protein